MVSIAARGRCGFVLVIAPDVEVAVACRSILLAPCARVEVVADRRTSAIPSMLGVGRVAVASVVVLSAHSTPGRRPPSSCCGLICSR